MKYKHRGGSVAQSTPGATAFASSYLGPTKYKIIFYYKCVHFDFRTLLLSLAQSISSQEKQNSFNNFQLRFKGTINSLSQLQSFHHSYTNIFFLFCHKLKLIIIILLMNILFSLF